MHGRQLQGARHGGGRGGLPGREAARAAARLGGHPRGRRLKRLLRRARDCRLRAAAAGARRAGLAVRRAKLCRDDHERAAQGGRPLRLRRRAQSQPRRRARLQLPPLRRRRAGAAWRVAAAHARVRRRLEVSGALGDERVRGQVPGRLRADQGLLDAVELRFVRPRVRVHAGQGAADDAAARAGRLPGRCAHGQRVRRGVPQRGEQGRHGGALCQFARGRRRGPARLRALRGRRLHRRAHVRKPQGKARRG
mmetsp:Transcript_49089/g.113454  ORF Transcript_49089/g.113454 Transcript_49089/m.113454 type:complete len:251 (-) Transcript_49089:325-1077(-)